MLTALLTYFAYVMILSHVFTDKKLGGYALLPFITR